MFSFFNNPTFCGARHGFQTLLVIFHSWIDQLSRPTGRYRSQWLDAQHGVELSVPLAEAHTHTYGWRSKGWYIYLLTTSLNAHTHRSYIHRNYIYVYIFHSCLYFIVHIYDCFVYFFMCLFTCLITYLLNSSFTCLFVCLFPTCQVRVARF